MQIEVRALAPAEAEIVIDYFHGSTEHLERMGVDPTRCPAVAAWHARFAHELALPPIERERFFVLWLGDGVPVGFSSCDKIVVGERANMHLHVLDEARRGAGIGTPCVKRSVDIYFETFRLKRLFCEPNAFNVAPNRTLQKAGFKYLKTHMTVPGYLNFHQAVTRWVIER